MDPLSIYVILSLYIYVPAEAGWDVFVEKQKRKIIRSCGVLDHIR